MQDSDKVALHLNYRKRRPCLISFSGVDCSGKSTQISAVIDRMRQRGERPFYIWLRVGYTPLFSALKDVMRRLFGHWQKPQGAVEAAGSLP